MTHWLFKSEPDEFSIKHLSVKKIAQWDGVRNYQARNFIRQMQAGDLAFFYHSSCKHVGIAGVMRIVGTSYPDPLAQDPESPYYDIKSQQENKWSAIKVEFVTEFRRVLSLDQIKKMAINDQNLASFDLIKKGSRLSVMPVTEEQWQCLLHAAESN